MTKRWHEMQRFIINRLAKSAERLMCSLAGFFINLVPACNFRHFSCPKIDCCFFVNTKGCGISPSLVALSIPRRLLFVSRRKNVRRSYFIKASLSFFGQQNAVNVSEITQKFRIAWSISRNNGNCYLLKYINSIDLLIPTC